MTEHYLQSPLSEADARRLKPGDQVFFSGEVFTCRSRLQRYVFDEAHALPFSTAERNVLIHVGPVVLRENNQWRLVAFTPTSSIRFEKWGPQSIEKWGLRAIIGKTTMGAATAAAMKKHGCVHLTPPFVGSNLFLNSITIQDVFLFDELGAIEAAWLLKLDKLGPFVVDIDSEGNNYFESLDRRIEANMRVARQMLNIPEDFSFTKLY